MCGVHVQDMPCIATLLEVSFRSELLAPLTVVQSSDACVNERRSYTFRPSAGVRMSAARTIPGLWLSHFSVPASQTQFAYFKLLDASQLIVPRSNEPQTRQLPAI